MFFILQLTCFRFRSVFLRDCTVLSMFLQYNLERMSVQISREPGKFGKTYLMFDSAFLTMFQVFVLSMLLSSRWSKWKLSKATWPATCITGENYEDLEWPSQSKYVSGKPRFGVLFVTAVSPACSRIESPINHMSVPACNSDCQPDTPANKSSCSTSCLPFRLSVRLSWRKVVVSLLSGSLSFSLSFFLLESFQHVFRCSPISFTSHLQLLWNKKKYFLRFLKCAWQFCNNGCQSPWKKRMKIASLWQTHCIYMCCLMTKSTKWPCAQRRLRSAWASVQSDQHLCYILAVSKVSRGSAVAQW